jgi:hypothetical protein
MLIVIGSSRYYDHCTIIKGRLDVQTLFEQECSSTMELMRVRGKTNKSSLSEERNLNSVQCVRYNNA